MLPQTARSQNLARAPSTARGGSSDNVRDALALDTDIEILLARPMVRLL